MALSRIKTNSIADSAITGAKISDGTVVASDIAALSVTPEKLSTGSPTWDASGNVTYTGGLTGGTGVVNLGSGQFYKDASGKIGLGTTSPGGDSRLHIYGADTINKYIRTQNNNGTGYFGTIGDGSSVVESNTQTIFTTGAGYTERMRIDSSGRVTKPYQPAFDVGRSGNVNSTADTFVKVDYNQAFTNIGSCFNISNGTFTAPVSGVYHFSVNLFVNKPTSTSRIDIGIYKNGANIRGHEFQGMRTDVGVNTGFNYSFTCSLAVNDYIEIFTRCFSNTGLIYGDSYFNRFSGFLVG